MRVCDIFQIHYANIFIYTNICADSRLKIIDN